jgi:hypothetical protein
MDTPFILRFQEACIRTEGVQVSAGTQTMTNVKGGDVDTDERGSRFEALGHASVSAGTMTKTGIHGEQSSDEDRVLSPQRLLPLASAASVGTNTMTRVRAEGGDTDPGARLLRAIPPCFSS